jgi:hypothetical protein
MNPGFGKEAGGKSWSKRSYKFTTPFPHHLSISQMLLHAEKKPEDYTKTVHALKYHTALYSM